MRIRKLRQKLKEAILAYQKNTRPESGFSLIEMMIVISIIALIGGFVTLNIMKRFDEAKMTSAGIQIKNLSNMLDDFRRICGRYPTTEEGLEALVTQPAGLNCKNYDPEGFIKGKKVPLDPWNDPFEYTSDGQKFVIKSHSPKDVHKDVTSED